MGQYLDTILPLRTKVDLIDKIFKNAFWQKAHEKENKKFVSDLKQEKDSIDKKWYKFFVPIIIESPNPQLFFAFALVNK